MSTEHKAARCTVTTDPSCQNSLSPRTKWRRSATRKINVPHCDKKIWHS